MKYFKEEIAGKGNKRYCFALGRDEAEIILGCLHKAHQFMPKTLQTELTIARIKQMKNKVNYALNDRDFTDLPIGLDTKLAEVTDKQIDEAILKEFNK